MTRSLSPRLSKAIATAVLAAMIPASTACFGSFNLTRQLYQFNREVSNDRWVRWIVFLGMAGFPVYAAGFVIDGLFGNAVEFWGGKSPFAMAPGTTHEIVGENGERLRLTVIREGEIQLDWHDATGEHQRRIVQEGDGMVAYESDGQLVGRVSGLSGEPQLELIAAH